MMPARAKLKIELDAAGLGKVFIDGVDISHCVTAISFKAGGASLLEVSLSILADIDADIEARLDQIALKKISPAAPATPRTMRLADGREVPVRDRAAN